LGLFSALGPFRTIALAIFVDDRWSGIVVVDGTQRGVAERPRPAAVDRINDA
jgi:hypothetical protein